MSVNSSIGTSIYLERLYDLSSAYGVVYMTWKDLTCLCVMVLGLILFLYGANYYNAIIGWTGVYLMVGSFSAEVIPKVYEKLGKKRA